MKKILVITLLAFTGLSITTGCRKFLHVSPVESLSGNDYWKTKADVEAFTGSIYKQFRNITMVNNMLFVATGDLRAAPANVNSAYSSYQYVGYLRNNTLGLLLSQSSSAPNQALLTGLPKWNGFYGMIQHANILYDQLDKLDAGILTSQEKESYRAEAVFMRSLAYFFLVRLYGDVPYYTKAYQSDPLPRTPMVTVLNNCSADLEAVKGSLPWTNSDANNVAVRASRGSIYILMMHLNMWAAGFDQGNKQSYYEKVASLGKDMMDNQGGAYELLPLDRSTGIFHGRSKEGLFEIVQNINAGEQFTAAAVYADYVLALPYKPYTVPKIYYDQTFMLKVYPLADADGRKTKWFDANIYNNLQQMLKFASSIQQTSADVAQNDNMIVFRYADVILLRAEAQAELGNEGEARDLLNLIRTRANATLNTSTGSFLKDAIYWERVREFMGEGHYFYDLVRTRKILDGTYAFTPVNADAFQRGAWTWPIDEAALVNNPYMTLNQYWR